MATQFTLQCITWHLFGVIAVLFLLDVKQLILYVPSSTFLALKGSVKLFCVSDAFMGIVGCLEQWVGEVLAQGAVIPLALSSVQGAILGIKVQLNSPAFAVLIQKGHKGGW